MSWLDRLSRRQPTPDAALPSEARCPHTKLLPQWDDPADLGRNDKASSFRCDACGQVLTPAEAEAVRASEGKRLRETLR